MQCLSSILQWKILYVFLQQFIINFNSLCEKNFRLITLLMLTQLMVMLAMHWCITQEENLAQLTGTMMTTYTAVLTFLREHGGQYFKLIAIKKKILSHSCHSTGSNLNFFFNKKGMEHAIHQTWMVWTLDLVRLLSLLESSGTQSQLTTNH